MFGRIFVLSTEKGQVSVWWSCWSQLKKVSVWLVVGGDVNVVSIVSNNKGQYLANTVTKDV